MQPARSATIKTMIGLAALTPSTSTFAASVSDAAQRGVGLVLVFAIVVVAAERVQVCAKPRGSAKPRPVLTNAAVAVVRLALAFAR